MLDCSQIERKSIENLDIVTFTSGNITKYYITANSVKNGRDYPLFKNLLEYLKKEDAHILSHLVFGSSSHYEKSLSQLVELSNDFYWPLTWVDGDACSCDCFTSSQVTAVSGVNVEPVTLDGKTIGSYYQDPLGEYCYLGNIHCDNISETNSKQALVAYEKMALALENVGMSFADTIRMWNYLDDLLEWYDDFNDMRTAFYKKYGVFEKMVPGGTGIGAGNPVKAAYVGELLAVKPKSQEMNIMAVPSPLQCPAIDYRSSFSRAVEIKSSDSTYISISGTASIDSEGNSVHLDDTAGQIDLTMKVISAILDSRGFKWTDTVKAIAYFKNINEVNLFENYIEENDLPSLPVSISHADICRDDLLFELELDALK